MPLFYLELCCELENVKEVVTGEVERWAFRVQCTHCGEEAGKHVQVERGKVHAVPGSRGEAHLVVKCKQCERVSSIEWIEQPRKGVRLSPLLKSDSWCPVLALECRGLEPVALELALCSPFSAISSKDNVIQDVVFDDTGDWADFDEVGDVSVCIYKMQARFVRG